MRLLRRVFPVDHFPQIDENIEAVSAMNGVINGVFWKFLLKLLQFPPEACTSRRRHTEGHSQVIISTRGDWLTCRDLLWRFGANRCRFCCRQSESWCLDGIVVSFTTKERRMGFQEESAWKRRPRCYNLGHMVIPAPSINKLKTHTLLLKTKQKKQQHIFCSNFSSVVKWIRNSSYAAHYF